MKNTRVLTVLIVTYCFFFLIATSFQLYAAVNTVQSVRQSEEEKTSLILEQYANHVDSIFKTINGINTVLKRNEYLLNLPFWNDRVDEMSYVNLSNELLKLSIFYNTYFDNIYIFNSRDSSVTSGQGKESQSLFSTSEHAFYQDIFFAKDLSAKSFVYQMPEAKEGYLYFFTQLRRSSEGFYTNAMYIIKLADLNEGFYAGGISYYFSIFSLIDNSFIGSNSMLSEFRSAVDTNHKSGSLAESTPLKAEGSELIAYALNSSVQPLAYVVATEQGQISGILQSFINKTIFMSVVFFLVMLFLIATAIWFQYTPIRNILKMIGINDFGRQNEYDIIKQYVARIESEYIRYENKLKSHVAHIENWFLLQIISNPYITESYVSETMESYDLTFPHDHFVVANIELINIEMNNTSVANQDELSNNYRLLMFAIENIVKESFSDFAHCKMIENKGTLVCIVNLAIDNKNNVENNNEANEENERKAMDAIVERFRQIHKDMKKHLNVDCKVLIGSIQNSIMKVYCSYNHVMDVAFYKNNLKLDSIFLYDDYKDLQGQASKNLFTDDVRYKFALSLKTANAVFARTILISLCEKVKAENWIVKRRLFSDFFDVMQEIYTDLELQAPEIEKMFYSFLKNYQEDGTFDENLSELVELSAALIDKINELSIPSAEVLVTRINQFVEENYNNPDINVSMIAEQFNITANYLSSIYSEYSKEGLHAYITGVRVQKAKELLVKKNKMKIKEIAEAVGYQNIRTFNRAFVLECGLSPTEYRSNFTDVQEY
ncbi:MAG: helix-turn-helix domain-containing protein [Christensenellales bacterium]|jgi:AraC-like DNA-binding protein